MKLGKYFTIEELTYTSVGVINTPNGDELANLKLLVENILDPLRELYGKPIHINSGFRNKVVNKLVGGNVSSAHLLGCAADITCRSKGENKKLFNLIKNNFEFRQLINEYDYSWIHVEYRAGSNIKQIFSVV